MSLVRVTGPDTEPVSLAEARLHLRLDDDFTADDELIETLIQAAREYVESETNRALLPQTWRLQLDCFPLRDALSLEASDVVSIEAFTYVDPTGSVTPFTAYTLDTDHLPARAVRDVDTPWPATRPQRNAIVVTMARQLAADATGIPAKIKAAIKLFVAHLYENREAVMVDNRAAGIIVPMSVDALLAEYRRPAAGMA